MSWYQLLSIYREAADIRRESETRPPQACPRCGEPLRSAPNDALFCLFGDGYEWPRDGRY